MKDNKLFVISLAEIVIGILLQIAALSGLLENGDILLDGFRHPGRWSGAAVSGVSDALNPEYKKRMETAAKDSGIQFISMRAKEAAFMIYLLIAAVFCIFWMLSGNRELGTLAGMSVCLLVLLYAVLFRILARKY